MTDPDPQPLTPEQQAILDKIPKIEGMTVVHLTPAYPPGCKHDWVYSDEYNDPPGSEPERCSEPSHCKLCGMSWTRYIFTECP